MRFLVISDIHAKKTAIESTKRRIRRFGAEAVLILGDITHFGPTDWAAEFVTALDSDVYAIPGNCDPREIVDTISSVATSMHGVARDIGGIRFAGLGGSNPTIFDTPFELEEEEIREILDPIANGAMVLMLHTPPYGMNDMIPSGINVGSHSIKEIVERHHPLLVLSGHIHEARGIMEKDGIIFLNPGPARDGYAAILDIDEDDISIQLLDPHD
ncbi:MAG: uncharacterized protein PWQ88_145 [Candidatus Methanomethylophilaceae archaeon]|nr:metallophosphoesterase family protein [Methanothrix soehngenii]MDI3482274.1 uncharacterized protein [Candidatus Methanomethylophilaceae archaeon]MDI3541716.1 uncharacterized protein [Candidatus Methanomethylophilaceae archaeon]